MTFLMSTDASYHPWQLKNNLMQLLFKDAICVKIKNGGNVKLFVCLFAPVFGLNYLFY